MPTVSSVVLSLCLFAVIPVGTPFLTSEFSSIWTTAAQSRHAPYFVSSRQDDAFSGRSRRTVMVGGLKGRVVTRCKHYGKRRSCLGAVRETATVAGEESLEGLTRNELQALCKKLNLRAVGKNAELIHRLTEAQAQEVQGQPSVRRADDDNNRDTIHPQAENDDVGGVGDVGDGSSQLGAASMLDGSRHIHVSYNAPVTAADENIEVLAAIDDGGVSSAVSSSEPTPTTDSLCTTIPRELTLDEVRPMFDELSDRQWAMVEKLGQLLTEWNGAVNLISRKDITNVMGRHIVPCLAMAKALQFEDGVEVLDVGTGGGLPGLPLAICCPNVQFTLIDGTGKKIVAVQDMIRRLGLTNARAFHVRAEDVYETYDYIIGRAVTSLPKFVGFIEKNLRRNNPLAQTALTSNNESGAKLRLKRGVLYMRGEATSEELEELGVQPWAVISLEDVLSGTGVNGGGGGGRTNNNIEVESNVEVEDGDTKLRDRGYSSVFHFTSEELWSRTPGGPSAAEAGREKAAGIQRRK